MSQQNIINSTILSEYLVRRTWQLTGPGDCCQQIYCARAPANLVVGVRQTDNLIVGKLGNYWHSIVGVTHYYPNLTSLAGMPLLLPGNCCERPTLQVLPNYLVPIGVGQLLLCCGTSDQATPGQANCR